MRSSAVRFALSLGLAVALSSSSLAAQSRLDPAVIAAIRDEATQRSEVMDHLGWLSDVYGPRLTGSPAIEQAAAWAMRRLYSWGLQEVHQERFEFGKGWSVVRFSAHLLEPQVQPMIGYPKAWSSSTAGAVEADVVRVQIDDEGDLETYRGTLAGKIVLTQTARAVQVLEGPVVLRMDRDLLAEAERMPEPDEARPSSRPSRAARRQWQAKLAAFWLQEGVVAVLDRGSDADRVAGGSDLSWRTQRVDGGTVFVGTGGPRDDNAGNVVPSATLAVEQYNRMVRVLDRGLPVRVEIEIRTQFHDETEANGFNILGEIPGTDLAHETVMLGAHFDSTHAGTGATDDAAGTAAMMETMRVLQAVGVRPRRTIRLGLWGGEEQGLLGSRAYVARHFGDAASGELLPQAGGFSTYFNIDNGAGRVRGVWLQENDAAQPFFERWFEPLSDLGITTLGPRSVGGTDHLSFDRLGLPGFQLMQDRVEYNSRTHHSNMDVYDRVQEEDMVQIATAMAVLAYSAAMDDRKMPRKPRARQ